MPVIRGQTQASAVSEDQRNKLADQLTRELRGEKTSEGPVVFEIPLDAQGSRTDVLVVWDAWKPLGSNDRSRMILNAYAGSDLSISQALGVTHQEAIEQQVLPYAVLPMIRRGEVDENELRQAMLAEGGIPFGNGKVDLRFPTMPLAEQAHRRLTDIIPRGYWSIVQTVGYVPQMA